LSYRVEFRPSGRRFTVEGGETVLEAALRAGLSPRYGCANGTCGDCLGRVLEGQVEPRGFAEHPIREADRAAGVVLLCACTPRSDLVVEAVEAAGADDIPPQSVRARVHDVTDLGGATALRLKVMRGGALRFLAGQHVRVRGPGTLQVEHALASCPCDAVNLELHLDPGASPAERALCALARNDKLVVEGPLGGMTLDEEARRPLLFVCTGTGFGPIKGIVEHVINRELELPVRLVRRTCTITAVHGPMPSTISPTRWRSARSERRAWRRRSTAWHPAHSTPT
jgi:CDP-4-dehydro-6-deoxyglucose reductase